MKPIRSFIRSAFQTITLAALLLTATTLSAGHPIFYNKPSDKALITWLNGQKIVVKKGLIFDEHWTFRREQVKEFEKLDISKDKKGIYTLHARFDLYQGERGLRVYAVFTYQFDTTEVATRILSCESEKIVKLGKW